MTREETKKRFQSWCQGYIGNNASDEDYQMFNNIMALLEQEPCEDAISRQAVIDITWENPRYTDALNVLTEVRDKVEALPSVTPKQMTGHWIDGVCSECGYIGDEEVFSGKFKYCPVCGVKMEGIRNDRYGEIK